MVSSTQRPEELRKRKKPSWVKEQVSFRFADAGLPLEAAGQKRPWEIEVLDERFFSMVLWRGHDGFADAYKYGYWTCKSLDQCLFRLLTSGLLDHVRIRPGNLRRYVSDRWRNKQREGKAQENVSKHYNLGEVFEIMLGPTMCYSCAYWNSVDTLEAAQTARLDSVCQKLGMGGGRTFCDMWCGWGSLILHAETKFNCDSFGITLSTEQQRYIENKITSSKMTVSSKLADYRKLTGKYQRIASVGMFEHVGLKNYRAYMKAVSALLEEDGLFLLHTIGSSIPSPTLKQPELAWVERNIFPGAVPPSAGQIFKAADGIFTSLDLENFGPHYDRTLMAWADNFEKGWSSISSLYENPDEFYRMWLYYLYACAAEFRAGRLQLWQIVFAKTTWNTLYQGVRPLF